MSKRLTTEEFIERANRKHDYKYDYSLVEYKNSNINVIIKCATHGEFSQASFNHLRGQNCPECSGNAKLTTERFIQQANKKHNNTYDYSLVICNGNKNKVTIICRKHGEFLQTPNSHLLGSNCPQCVRPSHDTGSFIIRAKEVHGNRYDYSLVDYATSRNKVIIRCHIHGNFKQAPSHHLQGGGCVGCDIVERTSDTDTFINRAIEIHGNKYDYSLVDYVGCNKKVTIICPVHGNYMQQPSGHLNGGGCVRCVRPVHDTRSFIEKSIEVHGKKYGYSLVDYIAGKTKVTIICKEHGKFEQRPAGHIRGEGCKRCSDANNLLDTFRFIEKAREKHGDTYDYSLSKYTHSLEKLIIICKKHGGFSQVASDHTTGSGCPKCASYGFDQSIPGYNYIHLMQEVGTDFTFVKYGITNIPDSRSSQLQNQPAIDDKTYVILKSQWLCSKVGKNSVIFENYLKNYVKSNDCTFVDKMPAAFDGRTETADPATYEILIEKLNNVNEKHI